MDVVGLGTFAMDVLMKVDTLPREDSFCIIESTSYLPGGSGTNVISQIAKLGGRCGYIGKVASDTVGKEILHSLEGDQVDISRMVVVDSGISLHTNIVVDSEGKKFIMLNMGNVALSLLESEVDYSYIEQGLVFYTDLFPRDPAVSGLQHAKKAGKKTLFNLQVNLGTMAGLRISKEDILSALQYVDVFAPCRDGLFELSRSDDLQVCRRFLRQYCKGILIFTLGKDGVVAFDEQDCMLQLPSLPVKAVDTTGAGDSFLGGFISSYFLQKQNLQASLRIATACAAYTCTGIGARSAPNRLQLEDFLAQMDNA